MPARFVVDASVVVEFLVPGEFGDPADRLIGGLSWREPLQLFAPDILLLEVANALRRRVLRKGISDPAADRAVEWLPQLSVTLISSGLLLEGAWSLRKQMTLYDAAYATLSKTLDRPLISTDARLTRACSTAGIDAFRLDQKELEVLLDQLEFVD